MHSQQLPQTDDSAIHIVSDKCKSNIVAVPVCPGLSRSDTIAPLNAVYVPPAPPPPSHNTHHICNEIRAARPFLPTLFKSNACRCTDAPEEVLRAAALYLECDIVNLWILIPATADAQVGHRLGVYDESAKCGMNKFHELKMDGEQHRTCKEIIEHDKLQARHNCIGSFLPAMSNTLAHPPSINRILRQPPHHPNPPSMHPALSRPPTHKPQPLILLLTHADFVIVGSGITGRSFVRRISDSASADGYDVRVIVLEARDPPKMIKLRLAYLKELRRVAEQEGILANSKWWEVESVDVIYNSDMFEKAKTKVQTYKAGLPFDAKDYEIYEAK
ncbi:hypothetical protein F4604DRAFT_1954187 [Suillus subluteus]|nr:hypothetical protein F4604DRAFT_1954187 [Suillus subluteus]